MFTLNKNVFKLLRGEFGEYFISLLGLCHFWRRYVEDHIYTGEPASIDALEDGKCREEHNWTKLMDYWSHSHGL